MNKKLSKHIGFSFLSILLLLSSCTQEDCITNHISKLTLLVKTNNFVSSTETRTPVEEGYKTVFKGGEQIGITAIKNGAVYNGMDNIPFTYDATTGTWALPGNGLPQLYYYPGVTYIAYYPYDSNMNGKKSEQEIIDAFTPREDQSTYADYTASDLMTETGTVTGSDGTRTITFNLQHRMAMIIVKAKGYCYITSDGYEYSSPIYDFSLTLNSTSIQPYKMSPGNYRYLVLPTTISQKININFTETFNNRISYETTYTALNAGKYYHTLLYNKKAQETRDLQPGDFYCNEGYIVPYDIVAVGEELPCKTQCIGIIYHVGQGDYDELSYYSGSGMASADKIHGYVIALKDAGSGNWGPRGNVAPIPQIERNGGDNGKERPSYRGYKNTKNILNDTGNSYPVFTYANQYNTATPAPNTSSGWYLPTIQQMQDIYALYQNASGNVIYDSMQKVAGTLFNGLYWTASQAYNLCSYNITMTNGAIDSKRGKNDGGNSRAALTF